MAQKVKMVVLVPPKEKSKPKEKAWVEKLLPYFEIVNQDREGSENRLHYQMKCKICMEEEKVIIIKDRHTKGFASHLQNLHKEKHEVYVKSLESDKPTLKKISQASVYPTTLSLGPLNALTQLSQAEPYSRDNPRQQRLEKAVINYIVLDSVPFSAVERPGFRLMWAEGDPKFAIPSSRTVGRRIDDQYALLQNLEDGSLHLIVDLWTSRLNFSVLGVTAQYVINGELKKIVVGFKQFEESSTAENIFKLLDDFIKTELGLTPQKIGTITSDNAANVCKAFSLSTVPCVVVEEDRLDDDDDGIAAMILEFIKEKENAQAGTAPPQPLYKRNSCLAHLLQLAIKDAIEGSTLIKELSKKVADIVALFGRSSKYSTDLKKLTGGIGLLKPCVTRWNSVYLCFKRLIRKMKDNNTMAKCTNAIINQAKSESKVKGKKFPIFTDEDIESLEQITMLLEPLAVMTDRLQGDKVTSSLVIPCVLTAVAELEDIVIQEEVSQAEDLLHFKNCLIDHVIQRFCGGKEKIGEQKRTVFSVDVFHDPNYLIATLLDPRSRYVPFEDSFLEEESKLFGKLPNLDYVTALLKDHVSSISPTSSQSSDLTTSSQESESNPPPAKKSLFSKIQQKTKRLETGPLDEVSRYFEMDVDNSDDVQPLLFWKVNERKFPNLAKLAYKYLAIPASSGPVERLFSVAGALARSRRASILVPNMEKSLCIRQYLMNELEKAHVPSGGE